MKARRFNWNLGFLIGAVVLVATTTFSGGEVSEIHNTESAANFALVDARPQTGDWPCWRGQDGRNVAVVDQFPTQWSSNTLEGWQVPLQSHGHSTPILWGDHLFLLAADPVAQRIVLRSFQRETGRPNWITVLHQGGLPKTRDKGTNASSTPACDGQSVFAVSAVRGSLWVTSVDFRGQIVWQQEAGPHQSSKGFSSAPVIYKNLVIVSADLEQGGYLTAFHRQTGVIVWRVRRPAGESNGIPVVAMIAGRSQLILGGKRALTSYDPATGNELWYFRWPAERVANSAAFDIDHVYVTHKQSDGEVLCIKANGSGNVTQTHLAWRQPKIGSESLSPVLHGEYLYVLSEEGGLTCQQAATGKIEWKKRLDGVFSASPIVAGEYLICCNQSGATTMIQTGPVGAIISVNHLFEGIVATPVVAGQSIFVRTLACLRRISVSNPEPVAERPEPPKRRL